MGRLEPNQKRVSRVLETWALLEPRFPDWTLRLVGDGPEKEALQAFCAERRLERVSFEGFRNPAPYYEQASLLLLASEYEGLPLAVVEGMSFGAVPLLYGSFSSAYDLVDHGQNGCILPASGGFQARQMADMAAGLMQSPAAGRHGAGQPPPKAGNSLGNTSSASGRKSSAIIRPPPSRTSFSHLMEQTRKNTDTAFTISGRLLASCAVAYMVLPTILFLAGWVRPLFSVPAAMAVAGGFRPAVREAPGPHASLHQAAAGRLPLRPSSFPPVAAGGRNNGGGPPARGLRGPQPHLRNTHPVRLSLAEADGGTSSTTSLLAAPGPDMQMLLLVGRLHRQLCPDRLD